MTLQDLVEEIDFVARRAIWLQQQPRDSDGELLCEDYRNESGMLLRHVEELERICESL
jgi:hypothetical protein